MSFEHLRERLGDCDLVFYKVLSYNDKSWSWLRSAHQSGFVVPAEVQSLIFPKKEADEGVGPDTVRFEREGTSYYLVDMLWDKNGDWSKYYTGDSDRRKSKFGRSYGDRTGEYRITGGLNKEMFKNSPSGSIIVLARDAGAKAAGQYRYYYDIYAPDEDDYRAFLEYFGFTEGFDYQFADITAFSLPTADEIRELVEQYRPDSVLEKSQKVNQLARMTWDRHMADNGMSELTDIFRGKAKPGDLIRDLWKLGHEVLKEVQKQICPFDVMTLIITEAGKATIGIDELMHVLAERFEDIRRLFVSINGSVSTIAGKAFEKHLELWLFTNKIPYEPQVKLDGSKIPDFTLSSKEFYYLPDDVRDMDDAMLLSAKTSLRERWDEIFEEGNRVKTRYLLTLDTGVSSALLGVMKEKEVNLVVTEENKSSLEAYKAAPNAITFDELLGIISKAKTNCEAKDLLWIPPKGFIPWWLR